MRVRLCALYHIHATQQKKYTDDPLLLRTPFFMIWEQGMTQMILQIAFLPAAERVQWLDLQI